MRGRTPNFSFHAGIFGIFLSAKTFISTSHNGFSSILVCLAVSCLAIWQGKLANNRCKWMPLLLFILSAEVGIEIVRVSWNKPRLGLEILNFLISSYEAVTQYSYKFSIILFSSTSSSSTTCRIGTSEASTG